MNPFETETMAELCLRQGHRHEALAIYRRLLARTAEEAARERVSHRIADIERAEFKANDLSPLQVPGVRARWSRDDLTIEWHLPADTQAPALEVLLVRTAPTGVLTERRAIEVDTSSGLLTMAAKGLHSARVAAGRRGPGGFVPLARG